MNYSVRFTASDGTVMIGEVIADEGKQLVIWATWQVKPDGTKEWNIFWVPKDKCVRL